MGVLLSSPPVCAAVRAGLVSILVALAACSAQQQPEQRAAQGDGRLFARGLGDIKDLYIAPISTRRVALAGAARLASLDNKLAVSDSFGNAVTLSYDGKDVAFLAAPSDADPGRWGGVLDRVIATAKQASPALATASPERIDKAVFDGITSALDHFSYYSPPSAARDRRAARNGFGGIGITFDPTDNLFRVAAVAPEGPAERAGIRPADRLIAVDGEATAGRPQAEVIRELRGAIGSTVAVSLLHPGSARPQDLWLHRAFVTLPTVSLSRDGSIAVFRIASFNHTTAQLVAAGLAEAQRQSGGHRAGIVLDLRGDPGGLLDQAVAVADLFMHDGPIVSTVGRNPASRQYFAASGRSVAPSMPIVVLINGGSASASEIVAAALQDAGRAVVVGSSSYGKGTVQTVLRLPNDGELTLTWARLITPSGYWLQTHGVVPTVCTSDLGDDARSFAIGLQRASAVTAGQRPRAVLDERSWSALRGACPGRGTAPAIDLQLAERVLASPQLYAAAVHALPPAPQLAKARPAGQPPEPALTGVDRALSSISH